MSTGIDPAGDQSADYTPIDNQSSLSKLENRDKPLPTDARKSLPFLGNVKESGSAHAANHSPHSQTNNGVGMYAQSPSSQIGQAYSKQHAQ
jgi:hypothetical protein